MTRVAELTGHTSRVLHMAMSPDGSTVVSAAGDETLRFWKIFDLQVSFARIDSSVFAIKSLFQRHPRRPLLRQSPWLQQARLDEDLDTL